MSDTVIDLAAGEKTAAANPLDQGRRLHQRQEWEQAFLAAQQQHPQAQPAPRELPAAHGQEAAATTATLAVPASQQGASAARPGATSAPPVTGQSLATNNTMLEPGRESTTRVVAVQPEVGARSDITARMTARANAATPRAPVMPPAPQRVNEPAEPVVVRAHARDGGVQMIIRDGTLTPERAHGLVARVRGMLQRFGLRLTALTLNGNRVVDAAPPQSQGAPSDRARALDLDLKL